MVQRTLITMTAFVPKDFAIKSICCCEESLISRMICKESLVLFLFLFFSSKIYVSLSTN